LSEASSSFITFNNCCANFRRGDMSTNVDSRSGMKKSARNQENIEKIRQTLSEERRIKVCEIAEKAGISKRPEFTSIHEDLMEINLSGEWVPHLPAQDQN
jgi:hypothetical protein